MRQVYPWVVLDTLHRFRSAFPSGGRFFAAVSFFYLFMYSPTPICRAISVRPPGDVNIDTPAIDTNDSRWEAARGQALITFMWV